MRVYEEDYDEKEISPDFTDKDTTRGYQSDPMFRDREVSTGAGNRKMEEHWRNDRD